jgi:hypothetical protein
MLNQNEVHNADLRVGAVRVEQARLYTQFRGGEAVPVGRSHRAWRHQWT